MGFISEFKEFAVKGNVMDMAVGVIIGGAFGKIVTSLVNDVLMPVISLATGGIDFTNLFVNLSDDVKYKTLAEAQENIKHWLRLRKLVHLFLPTDSSHRTFSIS